MRDGKNLRCVQNNPRVLRLRDSAPHHAIVLKMEDGSDLLLPIIVSMYLFFAWIHVTLLQILFWFSNTSMLLPAVETPSIMLLAALRNIRIVRAGTTCINIPVDVDKHPHASGMKWFFCISTAPTLCFFQPRPTIYNVVMEMTKRMGFEVRLR